MKTIIQEQKCFGNGEKVILIPDLSNTNPWEYSSFCNPGDTTPLKHKFLFSFLTGFKMMNETVHIGFIH